MLRLWAIHWRLPFTINVDEPVVIDQGSGILLTGDLNPHRFVYPSLQIYYHAAISWLHLQWGIAGGLYSGVADIPKNSHVITTAPGFYAWGRAGTAVLGALTVLFTVLSGRLLAGWPVGLVAGLLLAVSPLHVGHSRFVTPDVPASCFAALALLGAVAVLRQPPALTPWQRRGLYLFAGVGFGLATATKYNAAVIGVCLLLAHLLARPPRAWLGSADLWLAGAAALLAFFAVTPFALLDRKTFLEDVASIIDHYRTGHWGYESDQNWWWYLRWLLRNEPWLIGPALGGAVWAALRHRPADLVLLAFPLLSYAGLASYRVHFERNLLPLFPAFALLAAVLVAALAGAPAARWAGLRRLATPLLLAGGLALALPPALASADLVRYLTRPDSRPAAIAWVRANTPRGALVLADVSPQLWEGEPNIHYAEHVSRLHAQPPAWFSARGYQYVVASEHGYDKYLSDRARYPREAAAYDRLFAETVEVARFGQDGGYSGPEVRVLRLSLQADGLAMGQRLAARLGKIELLGATVAPVRSLDDVAMPREGGPAAARPGGVLGVTLFWRAQTRPDADYTVFIHVLDEHGRIVAQRDTPPQGGRSPTSAWEPGAVVVDPANVPLPAALAPGAYRVIAGLFRAGDGRRLPVEAGGATGGDSIEIGQMQVQR